MFTGLVQAVGEVVERAPVLEGVRLVVDPRGWDPGAGRGGSVAVNGCCLTLTGDPATDGGRLAFVAIPETLEKTGLRGLGVGSEVNLETAVSAATLMGGHFVQGHVDGIGRVVSVSRQGADDAGEWRVRLEPSPSLMRFMAPKGSVCLDGVSLTIADLHAGDPTGAGGWIEVALIPETLEKTTLRDWAEGDAVNIEADILAKTVVHHMEHYIDRLGIDRVGSGTAGVDAGGEPGGVL